MSRVITQEVADKIRRLREKDPSFYTYEVLGKRFGIQKCTVGQILKGRFRKGKRVKAWDRQ